MNKPRKVSIATLLNLDKRYCPVCGRRVMLSWKYCERDGKRVAEAMRGHKKKLAHKEQSNVSILASITAV